ncbi:cysteine-rich CWC family protein [uncultured Umboniibacter sp.]|uniref:cysteine-rich CWC family protein n=1 Tax=uncultured Umboniibacter sp. TaxID=1798917 RepID=UPI00343E2E28
MTSVGSANCPLCQSANLCGVDQSRCWCMNYTVDSARLERALLESVEPSVAQICVCEACLARIADLINQPCSIQREDKLLRTDDAKL